ncbi:uncharacterized protein LOC131063795 [Cryptomeria japonica]|uniref:uncharacterized protein LOC131063795 n=1 Tax=Cryptomeria japonica TaxID=3369 RepID=UPI0025AC3874|nr:uncharacterized protein LOC131063795 [Cryptomeria japonica]
MKILSWNIRGMNSCHKRDIVRNLARDHRMDIFLIQETKMSKERVEKIKFFKFCESQGSSSNGASGGAVTLWNSHFIQGVPFCHDDNHIATLFKHIRDGFSWILFNIYVPNNKVSRRKFWARVSSFCCNHPNAPWLVIGDFNTPLQETDKFGGSQIQLDSKQDLADFINDQCLIDLDLTKASFTWSNHRIGAELIQVRLDQALISIDWLQRYSCSLNSMIKVGSDHYPISLMVEPKGGQRRKFPFRFEKMWLSHPSQYNCVKEWSIQIDGITLFHIAKKMRFVKKMVKKME